MDTYSDPVTGVTIDYEWTAASQVREVVYGAAARRDYFYDDQGRLFLDEWRDASGIGVSGYVYGYDPDGNVTSKTISLAGNAQAGAHTYGYDDAGRLTSWTQPDATVVAYGWDAASNRTAAGGDVYSYDARNRLTTGPAGAYSYSQRGDVLAVVGAEPVTFGWDGLGRMVSADTVSYTYDGLSRVAERNGTGFAYTGLWIDPTSDWVNTYGRSPAGRVVAHDDGTTASLVGLDRHGDVTWLADPATGALSDSKVYDPFGEVAAVTGVSGITVGFQGDYTDPTSGEVWMGARWYDPTGAQFRTRDTIFGELMTPVSLNRYTYGFANPLMFWDPDGRFPRGLLIDGQFGSARAARAQAEADKKIKTPEEKRGIKNRQVAQKRRLARIESGRFDRSTYEPMPATLGIEVVGDTVEERGGANLDDPALDGFSVVLDLTNQAGDVLTTRVKIVPRGSNGYWAILPDGQRLQVPGTGTMDELYGLLGRTDLLAADVQAALNRSSNRFATSSLRARFGQTAGRFGRFVGRLGLGLQVTIEGIEVYDSYQEGGANAASEQAARGGGGIVGGIAAGFAGVRAAATVCPRLVSPYAVGACAIALPVGFGIVGFEAGEELITGVQDPLQCPAYGADLPYPYSVVCERTSTHGPFS